MGTEVRRRRLPLALALAVTCGLAVGGCDAGPPAVTGPTPVPAGLTVTGLAEPIKIGVLVDQDSAYSDRASGASVAQYRFRLGGADVSLVVQGTKGTVEGAQAGAADLLGQHVAGVIAAFPTAGLAEAVRTIADAGTPALVLYPDLAGQDLPAGAWWAGLSPGQAARRLAQATQEQGVAKPCLVTAARGYSPAVSRPADISSVADGNDQAADHVVASLRNNACDGLVIDAPGIVQAAVVLALRARLGDSQTPILLTPDAADPAFGRALAAANAADGRYLTVGSATTDNLALTGSAQADRAAAFFASLRAAAGTSLTDVTGTKTLARAAPAADIVSHDAVVALVRAAERAGSTDPGRVRDTLDGLLLTGADGLAGPDLNFAGQAALPDEAATVWWASTTDAGLRPASPDPTDSPGVFWLSAAGPV